MGVHMAIKNRASVVTVFAALRLVVLALVVLGLASCASTKQSYDAVVSGDPAQAGFRSLQAALDAAPENSPKPYRIYIVQGIYHEKLRLQKNNIQLIGAGRDKTRLVYDDYAGKTIELGKTL